ncbi:MAG TPA: hypothetical protein P5055_19910, partial [Candidatus Paceibacterota bacterium]|nr:hypothetical protein [Verrucomicrobiota bacterium]HSA03004.1 hypothetical protein [Candidatus Paceibacterota bacterium]
PYYTSNCHQVSCLGDSWLCMPHLAQRQHPPQEPGALHLTHQQDLLELELPAPDLSLYDAPKTHNPPDPSTPA